MDAIGKTWKQSSELWASLAPSQRLSLAVAPLLLLGGFAFLLWGDGGGTSMTPLAFGKVMTDSELDEAESVLHMKGLKEARRAGNQLLVPSAKIEEYHGALVAGGGLPSGWAEEFEKKFDESSVFTSGDQRRTMREIALAKEMRRWLRAIPEVVDGNVVWARSQNRVGFDEDNKLTRVGGGVTATVTLKPKPGREIATELAESVRVMIASAVPDLKPEGVVVFSTTGRVFRPRDKNDAFNDGVLRRIDDFTEMYRSKVESALSYIPGVLVTVNVDLDNVRIDISDGVKIDPKEGVDAFSETNTRDQVTQSVRPQAEPGAVSNQPQALQANSGPTQNTSDNSNSSRTFRMNSQERRHTEYHGGMPTGVQVSVGIPEEYYENAVLNTGVERGEDDAAKQAFEQAVADFKTNVQTDVTATVARTIGTTDERISVTSYVRVDPAAPTLTEPMLEMINRLLREWGGTVGLGLFALWALWMVSRAGGPRPAEDPDANAAPPAEPPAPPTPTEEDVKREEMITAREELQSTVRDNPEVAAAVIGKWIRAAQQTR